MPDISVRRLQTESMDDPALPAQEHEVALRGLRLLNRASRTAKSLWGPIHRLLAVPGHPPIRILDVATGSGDVPLALHRLAARSGTPVQVDGCDLSQRAVEIAASRAVAANVSCRFFRADAIGGPLPSDYDVVMCSLFMHHLTEEDAIEVLYKMKAAAKRLVLVSDLRRTRIGYALAYAASRVMSRSRVVRNDALLSVRAAWTIDEFRGMAHEAGLDGGAIHCVWPERLLLEWTHP